jgi:hypothetical protein
VKDVNVLSLFFHGYLGEGVNMQKYAYKNISKNPSQGKNFSG